MTLTNPTAPTRQPRQVQRVVAASSRRGRCSAIISVAGVQSPLASLTAVIRGCSASRSSVSGLDRDDAARRDVVEHHRQVGGVGDRGEVRQQAGLRRPRVVRRDDQQAVRAGLLGGRARSHAVRGVVGAGPGDHGGAVADRVDDRRDQLGLLGVGGGRRLPGGAVDHQAVVAQVDQVGGQLLGAGEVQPALGVERGDHRGQHPAERATRRAWVRRVPGELMPVTVPPATSAVSRPAPFRRAELQPQGVGARERRARGRRRGSSRRAGTGTGRRTGTRA